MAEVPGSRPGRGSSPGSDPLCFVLIPLGRKPNGPGASIDFDALYDQVIAPAIRAAGLEPIRADRDMTVGIAHRPMFERLILCDYAVADLTLANAAVFYELGVRHVLRPHSTVLLFASGRPLPDNVGRGASGTVTVPCQVPPSRCRSARGSNPRIAPLVERMTVSNV